MVEESRGRSDNRILVVALSVLALVIVVLILGIVILKVTGGTEDEGENIDFVLPDELTREDLSAVDQVIKDTSLMLQDPKFSEEDIENYYDNVISDFLGDGDTNSAIEIIIQKMNFLVVTEGSCSKAKKYINDVDLSSYKNEEKRFLASHVISMAKECDDQDLQDRWREYIDKWEDN